MKYSLVPRPSPSALYYLLTSDPVQYKYGEGLEGFIRHSGPDASSPFSRVCDDITMHAYIPEYETWTKSSQSVSMSFRPMVEHCRIDSTWYKSSSSTRRSSS